VGYQFRFQFVRSIEFWCDSNQAPDAPNVAGRLPEGIFDVVLLKKSESFCWAGTSGHLRAMWFARIGRLEGQKLAILNLILWIERCRGSGRIERSRERGSGGKVAQLS
jgi:hypothetical protein